MQGFLVVPYFALVRFGRWDEILAEPKPAHESLFTRAIWHFARGSAFAAKGDRSSTPGEEVAALAGDRREPGAGEDAAVLAQPAR